METRLSDLTHFPHFEHNINFILKIQNSRIYSIFNTCQQVKFQKNLSNTFRGN